jgi:hypothetical protein
MADKTQETFYTAIAEIAAFAFLYYAQYLLKVEGSLIFSSIILLVLLNVAIGLCPFIRKCYK